MRGPAERKREPAERKREPAEKKGVGEERETSNEIQLFELVRVYEELAAMDMGSNLHEHGNI